MKKDPLIERLLKLNIAGSKKMGLANMERLKEALKLTSSFADFNFKSIHVAGTNGKGSVTIKIAKALESSNYRTGLYTSPHISQLNERIKINGEMISDSCFLSLLTKIFELMDHYAIAATFFEVMTWIAFLYFAQEKVDFAVIETGVGGRLDATTIIKPVLSVITSISLDHTEWLGNTTDAIAYEKAGIIKPNTAVVIGPTVPITIIKPICQALNSRCIQVSTSEKTFEKENSQIALAALDYLSGFYSISHEAIQIGLNASQPCRFEVVRKNPITILDVAHNPGGLHALIQSATNHFPGRKFCLLFGLSKTKDISSCVEILAEFGSHFHLVEALENRGVSVDILEENLLANNIDKERIIKHLTINEGVQKALEQSLEKNEILIICGTFFIMSEARLALGFNETPDSIDLNERMSISTHA